MKINLNLKVREEGGGSLSPSPVSNEYFPEFTVTQKEGDEDFDLGELPDSGELTVKYNMVRTNENKKTGVCTYTFEIREIVSAAGSKSKAPSKNYNEDAGDALDRLAKEKSESAGEDY